MPEVSLRQAAKIVGSSHPTLWRRINEGELPITRRVGKGQRIRIDIEELRRFAARYNYLFDEDLAKKLIK